jgi:hypothetical protein
VKRLLSSTTLTAVEPYCHTCVCACTEQAAAALKAKRNAVAATAGLLKATTTDDDNDALKQEQEEEESTSVLVVAPGMASHPNFQQSFFNPSCAEPLAKLSALSGGGAPLVAECWCGGGLEFPVMLLSAPIAAIPEPEGGYKIYTTAGGEVSAEEYIAGILLLIVILN